MSLRFPSMHCHVWATTDLFTALICNEDYFEKVSKHFTHTPWIFLTELVLFVSLFSQVTIQKSFSSPNKNLSIDLSRFPPSLIWDIWLAVCRDKIGSSDCLLNLKITQPSIEIGAENIKQWAIYGQAVRLAFLTCINILSDAFVKL